MRRLGLASLWLMSLMVVLAQVKRAQACTAPICQAETFVPGIHTTLPANLHALWWTPGRDAAGDETQASDLHVTCTSVAGAARSMQVHAGVAEGRSVLVFDDAFAIGDQCEIAALCDDPYDDQDAGVDDLIPYARFTVSEPADPPATLTLVAGAAQWRYVEGEYDGSGDCFAPGHYVCRGTVRVDLSADDIAPWADALAFDGRVDDGELNRVAGHALSLAPGSHTVMMRALLPDGSLALQSETRSFTIEDCTTPQPRVDGGDTPLDAGDMDAGVSGPGSTDGGCSCDTAGRQANVGSVALWSSLLITCLAWQRSRRRALLIRNLR